PCGHIDAILDGSTTRFRDLFGAAGRKSVCYLVPDRRAASPVTVCLFCSDIVKHRPGSGDLIGDPVIVCWVAYRAQQDCYASFKRRNRRLVTPVGSPVTSIFSFNADHFRDVIKPKEIQGDQSDLSIGLTHSIMASSRIK
ncbi:hypothetical protein Dimus_004374, partial [Dionaea muscipula]